MNELLESVKAFNLIESGQKIMTDETKKEVIEFLQFLIIFSAGYSKFMNQSNNIFNKSLETLLTKMKNAGFSQKRLNSLCLQAGYNLKTE